MKLPSPERIISWAGWLTAFALAVLTFVQAHPHP